MGRRRNDAARSEIGEYANLPVKDILEKTGGKYSSSLVYSVLKELGGYNSKVEMKERGEETPQTRQQKETIKKPTTHYGASEAATTSRRKRRSPAKKRIREDYTNDSNNYKGNNNQEKVDRKNSVITDPTHVVTVDDLTTAVQNSIGERKISYEEAKRMAEHMLNFFGYSDRIIDNVLEPKDRDVFYMMEDSGLLTTEREETTLYDGRGWRINYWLFRKEKISELIEGKVKAEIEEEMEEPSIYDEIDDLEWTSWMSERINGIKPGVSSELEGQQAIGLISGSSEY